MLPFIACGIMVEKAVRASELLSGEGVSARVLDMATIKPIDREAVSPRREKPARSSPRKKHQTHGGLGTAVAEC
jgi:transketolase